MYEHLSRTHPSKLKSMKGITQILKAIKVCVKVKIMLDQDPKGK
jgi:hypothetical protein